MLTLDATSSTFCSPDGLATTLPSTSTLQPVDILATRKQFAGLGARLGPSVQRPRRTLGPARA